MVRFLMGMPQMFSGLSASARSAGCTQPARQGEQRQWDMHSRHSSHQSLVARHPITARSNPRAWLRRRVVARSLRLAQGPAAGCSGSEARRAGVQGFGACQASHLDRGKRHEAERAALERLLMAGEVHIGDCAPPAEVCPDQVLGCLLRRPRLQESEAICEQMGWGRRATSAVAP
jgi:hypothetical protein